MLAVEDLAAGCANTASAHTLPWDPSHHGKPSEHKTAMKFKIRPFKQIPCDFHSEDRVHA